VVIGQVRQIRIDQSHVGAIPKPVRRHAVGRPLTMDVRAIKNDIAVPRTAEDQSVPTERIARLMRLGAVGSGDFDPGPNTDVRNHVVIVSVDVAECDEGPRTSVVANVHNRIGK